MKITSVANGKIRKLEDVADEAFAGKMLGDGIAVVPSDGLVFAPAKAKVSMIFPTNHAIGLTTAEGCEILIHFGIDTVALKGEYFDVFVTVGDEVNPGDLLIAAELEKIVDAGYPSDIMVIITNGSNFKIRDWNQNEKVSSNEWLLELEQTLC